MSMIFAIGGITLSFAATPVLRIPPMYVNLSSILWEINSGTVEKYIWLVTASQMKILQSSRTFFDFSGIWWDQTLRCNFWRRPIPAP